MRKLQCYTLKNAGLLHSLTHLLHGLDRLLLLLLCRLRLHRRHEQLQQVVGIAAAARGSSGRLRGGAGALPHALKGGQARLVCWSASGAEELLAGRAAVPLRLVLMLRWRLLEEGARGLLLVLWRRLLLLLLRRRMQGMLGRQ
jgi:hypothetical protein